jgi:hypothetical protein
MEVSLSDLKVNVGRYDKKTWLMKSAPELVTSIEQPSR